MKSLFTIILGTGLTLAAVSCGSANDPYYGENGNYPNGRYPDNGVYRAPDGSVYRQGEVYRDRNGNVYQNGRIIRNGGVYTTTGRTNLPPGQAKKIYGGEAKDYAPGQQKKRYKNNGQWRADDDQYGKGKFKKQKNHGKKDRD